MEAELVVVVSPEEVVVVVVGMGAEEQSLF